MEEGLINDLLAKMRKYNDLKAFKTIFNHFYSKLIAVSRIYVIDEFYAEEIVSQVFIKLWDNRGTMGNIDNLHGYLYVMTKRLSLNHIRDNQFNKAYTMDHIGISAKISISNPEESLLNEELVNIIQQAYNKVPPKAKIVYQMVKEDGLKYKEVALVLNISVKTVEMHVGKVLKIMRQEIEKYKSNADIKIVLLNLIIP
ncbi:MAG: RNA polymerase sigma-70 factor [Flammeovirgaceae bacterium]|nr:RNA polymerase sigma-70 factor [Flammeovirgaceae bacterium]